jgi:hypothetical protein
VGSERHEAELCERSYQAAAGVFASAGGDGTFGSQLPAVFMDSGLQDVAGEVHAPLVPGNDPSGGRRSG